MSMIKCNTCGVEYDGVNSPICPDCLANQWASSPTFIKDKHDPTLLPLSAEDFRSVLSHEFIEDMPIFTTYAAHHGTMYFHPKFKKYCHFTPNMMTMPGSAIPAGNMMPVSALDGLVIADALDNPHAFAEDATKFQTDINMGKYKPLPTCTEAGCCNLTLLDEKYCQIHKIEEFKIKLPK